MNTRHLYIVMGSVAVTTALLFLLMVSCRPQVNPHRITVSIAPERYFVERIAGDAYEVREMVPQGVGPEEYDPTPQDISSLSKSALYFYMGTLGFEKAWLNAINENNANLKCIDISTYISTPATPSTHSHDGHEHPGADPHFWASVTGATAISKGIYEALIEHYPEDAQTFAENYDRLLRDIKSLEEECREVFAHTTHRSFVIYHPSLTYFAEEWGLNQLVLEQDGKEPTPAHLAKVIARAQSDSVRVVFVQKEFDTARAEKLAKEIGAEVYEIAPLSYDWMAEMRHILDAFRE